MTKFIKLKFKISDDQTNIDSIDKYRLAANSTEYGIISYNESYHVWKS